MAAYINTNEHEVMQLDPLKMADLPRLISIAQFEGNDVLRALARAKVEGNAVGAIKNILIALDAW